MTIFGFLALLIYATIGLSMAALMVAVPAYAVIVACRGVKASLRPRRTLTRERARAEAELREQYASGVLTLVGLEERLEDTLRAQSHLEVEHVLDDLPARPPELPRAARLEVVAALAIVLLCHSLPGRAAGVLLGLGAVLPRSHWRAAGYAFLAGVSLVAAPFAAILVALCAAGRWRHERL